MGLSLAVGILADLTENDPEGAEAWREDFAALNEYLESIEMPPHAEPERCEVWSADMFGYSGLHYLRRVAAHVDAGNTLPSPGTDDSVDDPLVERYLAAAAGAGPGLWSRFLGRRWSFARRFDHLLVHSDAEGFYLPADFANVLVPSSSFEIPGGMVGSAPRLLAELMRIAELLSIPKALTFDSEDLFEAADTQGEGTELWERYGVESYGCVVLAEACRRSIESGAALVFT